MREPKVRLVMSIAQAKVVLDKLGFDERLTDLARELERDIEFALRKERGQK